jgi:hypothetical protein
MKNGDQNDTNGNDEQKTPAPSQGNTLSMSPIKLGSLDDSLLLQDELNHTWVDMTAQENTVTRYDNVLLLNNNSFSSPKKLDFSFSSSSPGTGEFVPSSSAEVSSDDDINLTHVYPTADELEGLCPAAAAPLPTVHDEESTSSLPAATLGCSPSIQPQLRPVMHGTNSSPAQLQPSMHGAAGLATSIAWSSPPITVAPPAVATLAAQPWAYPPAPYVAAPLMPNTVFPQSQCAPLVGAPWGFNAQTSHVMKSTGVFFSPLNTAILASNVDMPSNKCLSYEEIVAFGGIKNTDASGVRSSERIRAQPNSHATQMERAMLMAQRRDDNAYHGMSTPIKDTVFSMSDAQILEKARALGVSLGGSSEEQFKSLKLLKDNELQRTLTMLDNKKSIIETGEFAPHCLVVSRASNLSEDLDDEESFINEDVPVALVPKNKAKVKRKNKSYDKTNVRRSSRIIIKKSKS